MAASCVYSRLEGITKLEVRISDCCFLPSCRCQVHKVVQGTEHRPFNPKSDAHQAFLRKQLQKVDNLERKYPRLNLDDERGCFEAQILEPVAASGH